MSPFGTERVFVCVSERQTTLTLGLFRGGLKGAPRRVRNMAYTKDMKARRGESSNSSRRVGGSHICCRRDQGH
jgi:hypothetical protein